MYYEIIYEDGSKSVACYDSDEEALSAAGEHHNRALQGGAAMDFQGAPPAVRVVKLLKYENHPGDWGADQTLSADEVGKAVQEALTEVSDENGVVRVPDVAARVRDLTNPHVNEPSGPHESQYKAQEVGELVL